MLLVKKYKWLMFYLYFYCIFLILGFCLLRPLTVNNGWNTSSAVRTQTSDKVDYKN